MFYVPHKKMLVSLFEMRIEKEEQMFYNFIAVLE